MKITVKRSAAESSQEEEDKSKYQSPDESEESANVPESGLKKQGDETCDVRYNTGSTGKGIDVQMTISGLCKDKNEDMKEDKKED